MVDVEIKNEGSLIGFKPMTPEAKAFFADRVQSSGYQWLGPTLWVEHRMADMLAIAITTEGFRIGGQS